MFKALTVNELIAALTVARNSAPGRGDLKVCLSEEGRECMTIFDAGIDTNPYGSIFQVALHKLGLKSLVGTPATLMHQVYLHLFHGRKSKDEGMEDWGEDGPFLGPFEYVHTTYGDYIHLGVEGGDNVDLNIIDGVVYYDGMFYGDWSVFNTQLPFGVGGVTPQPVDAAKAKLPADLIPLKPKVKVFVEMYGGTIQNVFTDSLEVTITDVVVIENSKYSECEGDVFIKDEEGKTTEDFIYSHQAGVDIITTESAERIMAACQERIGLGNDDVETSEVKVETLTPFSTEVFQVGDTVKVAKIVRDHNFTIGFNNDWVDEMDAAVGQECKVHSIDDSGINLEIRPGDDYWFPPASLELVRRRNDSLGINDK